MRKILVDSSLWISYFRDSSSHLSVDELIKNNLLGTNDLILSELIPYLIIRSGIIPLLYGIFINTVALNYHI